jgi:beclin 1
MSSPVVMSPSTDEGPCFCSHCHCDIRITGDPPSDEEDISQVHEAFMPPPVQTPICEDCMNAVLESLKSDIASANNELSMYTEALFELEQDRRSGARVDDESESRFLSISQRERELLHAIGQLDAEEASLQSELAQLMEENRQLDIEESKLKDTIVSLTRTIVDSDESMDAVNRKLQYCQSSLRRLKRVSLIDEAFDIHIPGQGFASINGFRMGQPGVAWSEVNTGLGFTCLLLDILVKRANLNLSQYRLLPRGSYSVIIKKSDKSVLELFADETSGGISRFLTGRKFDAAMTAFVQIVGEMIASLQREDRSFVPPFPIDEGEGKIDGLAATLQFNSDENWSRALRMLLTDIKSLATYIDSKIPS